MRKVCVFIIFTALFVFSVSCITDEDNGDNGNTGNSGDTGDSGDSGNTGELSGKMCGPNLTREEWESEEWKNGDADGDGIPNWYECPECPCRDTSGNGIPDYLDTDSDGDGIPDYEECPPLNYDTCEPLQWEGMECINNEAHGIPDDYPYCVPPFDPETGCRDTNGDGIPDYLNLDSDSDGISDADERNGRHGYVTCPYLADTDGDGSDDLAEIAYGSDPTDPDSTIPPGIFYVVLPYNAHFEVNRVLTFSTRVEAIDILIVFDDSGSMGPYINNLKQEAKTKIIDAIANQFSDNPNFAAYGLVMYGWENPYEVYQHITFDSDLVANGIDRLRGNQGDEMAIPALYLSATGEEFIATLKNCLPPAFGGCDQTWLAPAQYNVQRETCEGQLGSVGGACFRQKSMPIYIHISDEAFMDCISFTHEPPTWTSCMWDFGAKEIDRVMAVNAMNGIGAKFIGIDSSFRDNSNDPANACKDDYEFFAKMTGSVDGSGNTFNSVVKYSNGTGMSDEITDAILDLITFIDMDVTTGKMSDEFCAETNVAEFVKSSRTISADPPEGIASQDETTFYSVTQGTDVTFDVTFYNDFCQNLTTSWAEYKALVTVLGNGSYLSSRLVHVIVPETLQK